MKVRKNSKRKASASENERSSSVLEDPLQTPDDLQEEPRAKKANNERRRSSSRAEEKSSVRVKVEPRGSVEELSSNEYYQLDPDSVRMETELCSCPPVEKGEVGCGKGSTGF